MRLLSKDQETIVLKDSLCEYFSFLHYLSPSQKLEKVPIPIESQILHHILLFAEKWEKELHRKKTYTIEWIMKIEQLLNEANTRKTYVELPPLEPNEKEDMWLKEWIEEIKETQFDLFIHASIYLQAPILFTILFASSILKKKS